MAVGTTYGLRTERTSVTRGAARPVEYPTGDGKPMGETDRHVLLIIYCLSALSSFYAEAQDTVYIAGNNFLYYEEGNPKACVSPDSYVVFGVPMRVRDSYKIWEEGGCAPAVVFEFTSKKTKNEDLIRKHHLYEQVLKVPEYFLFDPTNDYIAERLRGFRLSREYYVPIPLTDGRMYSEQLRLDLVVEGDLMRFFDTVSGRFLPTLAEAESQRQAQAERADAEAQRANAEAIRADTEAQRADAEAIRAEAEAQRANAEAQRARDTEGELARLRAEIDALRGR